MKHPWIAFLSFFLFISGSLRAQNFPAQDSRSYHIRQIEDAIREKLHPPANSPLSHIKSEETPQASGEANISSTYPESEVHAAINPTDTTNIVVGAMNIGATGLQFPLYYTTDFGTVWKKSTFRPLPYENNAIISGGGDPVFAYDANGKLYMTWIDTYGSFTDSSGTYIDSSLAGMYWAYSTNGGQTWQRPLNGYIGRGFTRFSIDSATGAGRLDTTTGFDDKEWIAVDRSNSPHRNTLYVAWTHLGVNNYGVMVRRKLPGVDSMLPPVRISPKNFIGVQYTSLGVDAQGGVHVTFMATLDTENYGIYQCYSSDGGASFQPPVKISDADIPGQSLDAKNNGDLIFGIRPNGNYPCPHLSIDTSGTGNLYEVWDALGTTTDQQHGADIYFSRSTNNGAMWSPATVINNDTVTGYTDHFYPSIAVNGKGMISVTWYDRREDPNNTVGRYYIAQSTDQGHTWTNAPVAPRHRWTSVL